MRIMLFGLSVAVLVTMGFLAITVFAPRVHDKPLKIVPGGSSLEAPSSTTTTTTRTQPQTPPRQPAPPGFKGPTSQPHIIGPTSPPPNY